VSSVSAAADPDCFTARTYSAASEQNVATTLPGFCDTGAVGSAGCVRGAASVATSEGATEVIGEGSTLGSVVTKGDADDIETSGDPEVSAVLAASSLEQAPSANTPTVARVKMLSVRFMLRA